MSDIILKGIVAKPFNMDSDFRKENDVNAKERIGFLKSRNDRSFAAREINDDDPILRRLISFFVSLVSEKITMVDRSNNKKEFLVNTNSLAKNLNLDKRAFCKADDEGKAALIEVAILRILEVNGRYLDDSQEFLFVPAVVNHDEENLNLNEGVRDEGLHGLGQLYKVVDGKPELIAEGIFENNKLKEGQVFQKTDKIDIPERFFERLVDRLNRAGRAQVNAANIPRMWYFGEIEDFKPANTGKLMLNSEDDPTRVTELVDDLYHIHGTF